MTDRIAEANETRGSELRLSERAARSASLARDSIRRAGRSLYAWLIATTRRRSLAGEILALQLGFAVVISLLALSGLWLASS
jgi:hypothetical protein